MQEDLRNDFQKRIGVGEPSRAFLKHKGSTRKRPVIVEEGSNRGSVGGFHKDHWDGRTDAVVTPQTINAKIKNLTGDKNEQKG